MLIKAAHKKNTPCYQPMKLCAAHSKVNTHYIHYSQIYGFHSMVKEGDNLIGSKNIYST